MEKISSILPGNPRVHSVDLEGAPPARPGAPAFGRKSGRNTVADRVTLSNRAKELAAAAQDTMMMKNPKEVSRTKMVEDLNRRFFETRLQKPAEKEMPQSEAVVDSIEAATEADLGELREVALQSEAPTEVVTNRLSIEA